MRKNIFLTIDKKYGLLSGFFLNYDKRRKDVTKS